MSAGPADRLLGSLQEFDPRTADEARDVAELLAVAALGNPWDRSTPLHATASALVLHVPTRRVLLRWHQRQQAWLQIGGHADPGEDDPLAVAIREGTEETGLVDLAAWPSGSLQHVVIVPVPANDREPAHRHADLRFFLVTQKPETATPENLSAPLRWLAVEEAATLTTEANVRETIRRAADTMS